MSSTYPSHHSPSYLQSKRQHPSSCFRSFASRCGAWTSIGTTVCLRWSCSSCLSAPWYGRQVYSIILPTFPFSDTGVQRVRTLTEFRTMSVTPYPIQCYRDASWTTVQTDQLYPGDLVSISMASLLRVTLKSSCQSSTSSATIGHHCFSRYSAS